MSPPRTGFSRWISTAVSLRGESASSPERAPWGSTPACVPWGCDATREKHARILDGPTRAFFQRYADGVNAYIETRKETFPLEFKLAGIVPEPWAVEDSLAVLYLMAWNTSANVGTEIVTQMLVEKLGAKKAQEIFPLNINPDDPRGPAPIPGLNLADTIPTGLGSDSQVLAWMEPSALTLGSNNWVTGPAKSKNRRPIVANDPHLDARILPGPWYPVGMVTPKIRAVGVNIAGIPGIVVGRTAHTAFGVTNAYGDMQDLYVETVDPDDPDKYREGAKAIPFEVLVERIRIRDKDAADGYRTEKIRIRQTRRGPVVSGVLKGLETDKVITARFAPFETMHAGVGFDKFLTAGSVEEMLQGVRQINIIGLNLVFADTAGNFGWWVTGTVPRRPRGGGTVPFVVADERDNWEGWIPFEEKPHSLNPDKGWVGTCNHTTIAADRPDYYSSYFSHSFRYRRLMELMDRSDPLGAADHWQFQRDTKNMLAVRLAPIMAGVLEDREETRKMGEILAGWNFHDDPDQVAPTIFQAVWRQFAFQVFEDDLGPEGAALYLDNWYIWTERLLDMVVKNDSAWFDDIGTPEKTESRDDLICRAAVKAAEELGERLGRDPAKWRWGRLHQLELVSPIRRKGIGKGLLGGGRHPAPGSGETLCRGWYDINDPYSVTHSAALRMVADLADDEKVLAVQPGGVSGRIFDPHFTDQIPDFFSGRVRYWWFSDAAMAAHSASRLIFDPVILCRRLFQPWLATCMAMQIR